MAKKKKEWDPISIRMDQKLNNRLIDYCDRSGQSKTVAIERAVEAYIDAYDKNQKKIEK